MNSVLPRINRSIKNTGIARLEFFTSYSAKTIDTPNPKKHKLAAILQKIYTAERFVFILGFENAYNNAKYVQKPSTTIMTDILEDSIINPIFQWRSFC